MARVVGYVAAREHRGNRLFCDAAPGRRAWSRHATLCLSREIRWKGLRWLEG
jgi:hypothetical protein